MWWSLVLGKVWCELPYSGFHYCSIKRRTAPRRGRRVGQPFLGRLRRSAEEPLDQSRPRPPLLLGRGCDGRGGTGRGVGADGLVGGVDGRLGRAVGRFV